MEGLDLGAEKKRRDMDIIEKAKAKGEDLRKSGWNLRAIRVSQGTEDPVPQDHGVLILRMDKITEEQMTNLTNQVRRDEGWVVLFDFGDGRYRGVYTDQAIKKMSKSLERRPPTFVWESGSERKGRKLRSIESNRR